MLDVYTAPEGRYERCGSAIRAGRGDWMLFCPEGAAPAEGCPEALEEMIAGAEPADAAFEPRTLPYESGKYYDPVTLETECLGACFAVRRAAFDRVGGFGRPREGEAANMALSRRLRAAGYRLRCAPRAVVRSAANGPLPVRLPPEVFVRAGGGYALTPPTRRPRFTVVIRTCQRPETLRLTLACLRWQTYRDFFVIVVEDGEKPVSRAAADEARAWLDVSYLPANARWGRCRAGNEGVARAKTEYVCFLDDDDYLFAEHFEVMARAIENAPDCGLWCAMSVEGRCAKGARALFTAKTNMGKRTLTAVDFCVDNPVPIQAVVFRRSLYEACGGLDVEQDALEDWDLWLRMVNRAPVAAVAKATSIYRVPADPAAYERRRKKIERYRLRLLDKMRAYTFTGREIYELFARMRDEPREETPLDRGAWAERARAISGSTFWRLTAPLRRLLRAIEHGAERLCGPDEPDWDDASARELHDYCLAVERSPFWRMFAPLRRLRGAKKNADK